MFVNEKKIHCLDLIKITRYFPKAKKQFITLLLPRTTHKIELQMCWGESSAVPSGAYF